MGADWQSVAKNKIIGEGLKIPLLQAAGLQIRPNDYWIARYTALDISRQLRDRSLSIEAIADLFHFSSLSHFSRYVQNNLGATPSSFRE